MGWEGVGLVGLHIKNTQFVLMSHELCYLDDSPFSVLIYMPFGLSSGRRGNPLTAGPVIIRSQQTRTHTACFIYLYLYLLFARGGSLFFRGRLFINAVRTGAVEFGPDFSSLSIVRDLTSHSSGLLKFECYTVAVEL